MEVALITSYNPDEALGILRTAVGLELAFSYAQGQTIVYGGDLSGPEFSGRHEQQDGFYKLMDPDVGDPVVFERGAQGAVARWSYAQHLVDAVERVHGTRFRLAQLVR